MSQNINRMIQSNGNVNDENNPALFRSIASDIDAHLFCPLAYCMCPTIRKLMLVFLHDCLHHSFRGNHQR